MSGKKGQLTRRQKIFVAEYVKCFNASEAARRAGYSQKAINVISANTMKIPVVKAAIDAHLAEIEMSAEEALKLIAEMARGEKPTKRVQTSAAGATTRRETFEQLDALDKVIKIHGRYKQNLDLTSGGEPLTVKIIKGVSMDEI